MVTVSVAAAPTGATGAPVPARVSSTRTGTMGWKVDAEPTAPAPTTCDTPTAARLLTAATSAMTRVRDVLGDLNDFIRTLLTAGDPAITWSPLFASPEHPDRD
jgi:hypothetical protein